MKPILVRVDSAKISLRGSVMLTWKIVVRIMQVWAVYETTQLTICTVGTSQVQVNTIRTRFKLPKCSSNNTTIKCLSTMTVNNFDLYT